jgi:hypothetical protein
MSSIVSHDAVFEGGMCVGVTVSILVMLSEAKHPGQAREILRYAQDDKRGGCCTNDKREKQADRVRSGGCSMC